MDTQAITPEQVLSLLQNLPVPEDAQLRRQLKDAARNLVQRLETPPERAVSTCFENYIVHGTVHATIDMGLWEAWVKAGGGQKSLAELAGLVPVACNVNLLRKSFLHCVILLRESGMALSCEGIQEIDGLSSTYRSIASPSGLSWLS